jgi:hypothetical protein
LIAWFVLAGLSTVYVAIDQFQNNPEPTVMKWGFIGVADQDGLALVDGDLRRTDLNHEWHGDALPLRGPVGARAERRRLVARRNA